VNNQTRFYAGTLGDDLTTVNVDLSKEFKVGLSGPLNVAVGAEYRREGYQIEAGEPNSYIDGGKPDQFGNRAPAGAQVFPGFRPSNEIDTSRNSKAIYVDVEGDSSRSSASAWPRATRTSAISAARRTGSSPAATRR
jgi:iron complex outermembrane receptor protein